VRRLLCAQIELVTTLAPNASRVKVDPASIEQGARQSDSACPRRHAGGGRVTIETRTIDRRHDGSVVGPPGSYVLIAVRDTGDGMDAERASHA
jgi:hypothetical protein